MKRARFHNSLRCPCCGEMCPPSQQRMFLKQLAADVPARTYVTLSGTALGNAYWIDAKKGLVDWACDDCLQAGRALKGQPVKQLFCDFSPHFAYADKTGICRDCKAGFTFAKAEQQYWYERLRFWVQATKVRCDVCQQLKKQHDHVSRLVAANDYSNLNAVRDIVAYYLVRADYQKARDFLAAGKKQLNASSADYAALAGLLDQVKQAERAGR